MSSSACAGPREHGAGLGLEIHAGPWPGIRLRAPVAAIPQIVELNIGHFLIGEAIFVGLDEAVAQHAPGDGRGPGARRPS